MRFVIPTVSALLFVLLAACNTVEGAGQDIEAGGDAVSETARSTERELNQ